MAPVAAIHTRVPLLSPTRSRVNSQQAELTLSVDYLSRAISSATGNNPIFMDTPTTPCVTSMPPLPPKLYSSFRVFSRNTPPTPSLDHSNEQYSNSPLSLRGPGPISLVSLPLPDDAASGGCPLESVVPASQPPSRARNRPATGPPVPFSQPPSTARNRPATGAPATISQRPAKSHKGPAPQPPVPISQPPPKPPRRTAPQPRVAISQPPATSHKGPAPQPPVPISQPPPKPPRRTAPKLRVPISQPPATSHKGPALQPPVPISQPPPKPPRRTAPKPRVPISQPPATSHKGPAPQPPVPFSHYPQAGELDTGFMDPPSPGSGDSRFATPPNRSRPQRDLSPIKNMPATNRRPEYLYLDDIDQSIEDPLASRNAPHVTPRINFNPQDFSSPHEPPLELHPDAKSSGLMQTFSIPVKHDPFFSTARVVGLNTTNFSSFLSSRDATLVLFYDRKLPKSREFESIVSEAACGTKRPNHAYAGIDCGANMKLCLENSASKLPLVRLYSKTFCLGEMESLATMSPDALRQLVEMAPDVDKSRMTVCSRHAKTQQ